MLFPNYMFEDSYITIHGKKMLSFVFNFTISLVSWKFHVPYSVVWTWSLHGICIFCCQIPWHVFIYSV